MPVERRDPAVCNDSNKKEGKGEMTKAPICLQDLRRSLYVKAKAEPTWRFWGLYVQVCKMETLHEAYQMAKKNDGAPGIDGVTFDAIEESGVERFLQQTARSSGLSIASQCVPALRIRSVDRSLAPESGHGRCDCRPLCG